MANNDAAILILAAGKGTRLKSSLAKVLHHAGGARWWSTWCVRASH